MSAKPNLKKINTTAGEELKKSLEDLEVELKKCITKHRNVNDKKLCNDEGRTHVQNTEQ